MPLPTEQQRKANELREAGKTINEIGEALGVSASRAGQLVERHRRFLEYEPGMNKLLNSSGEELLDFQLIYLPVNTRSYNALNNAGIRTVRQLMQKTERELSAIKKFGFSSVIDVRQALSKVGLQLPGPRMRLKQPKLKKEVNCPQCGHHFEV